MQFSNMYSEFEYDQDSCRAARDPRHEASGGFSPCVRSHLFLPLHFAVSPACSFVSVVCCLCIVFRIRPPHPSHRLEQTEPPWCSICLALPHSAPVSAVSLFGAQTRPHSSSACPTASGPASGRKTFPYLTLLPWTCLSPLAQFQLSLSFLDLTR